MPTWNEADRPFEPQEATVWALCRIADKLDFIAERLSYDDKPIGQVLAHGLSRIADEIEDGVMVARSA